MVAGKSAEACSKLVLPSHGMLRTALQSLARAHLSPLLTSACAESPSKGGTSASQAVLRRCFQPSCGALQDKAGPPTPDQEKAAAADGDAGVEGTAAGSAGKEQGSGSEDEGADSMSKADLQASRTELALPLLTVASFRASVCWRKLMYRYSVFSSVQFDFIEVLLCAQPPGCMNHTSAAQSQAQM